MIRVWGRRSSVNVQKVLWALGELDVPFTRETVGGSFGGNRDPDYLRMNPNGLIPTILDGDITMFESNAIVRYLAARYRAGLLRPDEPHALALAEQWMEWQQTTFAPAVTAVFFQTVRLPVAQRDARILAEGEKAAEAALAIADEHLSRHDWFAGADFSFGDIVMGCLYWRYSGLGRGGKYRHIEEWFDAVKRRPAFRAQVMLPVATSLDEWNRIERELT